MAAVPKVFVGKWKTYDEEDKIRGGTAISENGVMTTDSDDRYHKCEAFEYLNY